MAKRELVDARPSNAQKCCQRMAKLESDETSPLGCKYPTPPCALSKILSETTVRAQFRQIENSSPITDTFITFSTNLLYPCMYTRGEFQGAKKCMYIQRFHTYTFILMQIQQVLKASLHILRFPEQYRLMSNGSDLCYDNI